MTSPRRQIGWLLATMLMVLVTTPTSVVAAAAPQGEYASTLRFEVDSITPALVTEDASTVVIRGSMINTGSEELTGVVARWQRGDAFQTTDEVRAEIDDPGQPERVMTSFAPVAEAIGAGETVDFAVRTDAFTRPRSGLGIQATGVYPVMVNVNASFASGPRDGARVGELHTLLTIGSVPDGTAPTGSRHAVSMLVPLVDRPHRDPTGAFFDDDLAALIAPGGRLEDVLSAAEAPGLPAGAVTLAVDPELLEELQLMAAGYTVGPFLFDITRGTGTTPTTAGTTDTAITSAPPTGQSPTAAPTGAVGSDAPATGDAADRQHDQHDQHERHRRPDHRTAPVPRPSVTSRPPTRVPCPAPAPPTRSNSWNGCGRSRSARRSSCCRTPTSTLWPRSDPPSPTGSSKR